MNKLYKPTSEKQLLAKYLKHDLDSLKNHFSDCQKDTGTFHSLKCYAESVHGFVSSRIITSTFLVLATATIIAGGLSF